MKLTSGFDAPKTLNANNMETLIECQSEGDIKGHPLLAPCESEDSICQLIEVKKRKKVPSWPFLTRRLSPPSDFPGALSLFDQPLAIICGDDDTLPKPIQDILAALCLRGPATEGIFRKAASEKARKELKEELNSGAAVDVAGLPVHLLAVVFKDFLRGIPQKLLSCDLFEEWMGALEKPAEDDRVEALREIADKLPRPNFLLLRHLLLVLHLISKNSEVNKMDASNLAICIGPNVLSPAHDHHLSFEAQKNLHGKVKTLVEFLIDNCLEIFGEDIPAPCGLTSDDSLEHTDSSDTSTLQNDSAYDSNDPDGDATGAADSPGRQPPAAKAEVASSDCRAPRAAGEFRLEPIASTVARLKSYASQPDRRYSEPGASPSQECLEGRMTNQKLTRSEDDFTRGQAADPFPEEVFPAPPGKGGRPGDLKIRNLAQGLALRRGLVAKAFSSGSLDGAAESPPPASPSSPKRNFFTRHQSFTSKTEKSKPSREIKKHSVSFSFASHKQVLAKPPSVGPGRAKGFATGDQGKRVLKRESQLAGRIVQETGAECHSQTALDGSTRSYALLVDEVFPLAAARGPGSPPSYEEAVRCQAAGLMACAGQTVASMRARMLGGDSQDGCGRCRLGRTVPAPAGTPGPWPVRQPPEMLTPRTTPESLQREKLDGRGLRCSQPVFEADQLQYAKESYI
uniref:T-cell activation Rho GTPase-activating protein n=1 Tax=Oryctolagus cuniculus TaxID=9986 RepID=G1SDQ7_RABIT|nr:T-cell activation Rho GTPase-activating protein [Oryctolagus cuniculus]